VIADRNSSVPLAALKAGVPVVTVSGLAVFPGEQTDLYGLIHARVVPAPPPSLRDLRPEALAAFYDAGWADRFRRYDASYGRAPAEVAAEVGAAVRAAAGEPQP
jgi:hypothetical protein